jgi:hypothetical protein
MPPIPAICIPPETAVRTNGRHPVMRTRPFYWRRHYMPDWIVVTSFLRNSSSRASMFPSLSRSHRLSSRTASPASPEYNVYQSNQSKLGEA